MPSANMESTQHSAAGSAAGYLYQCQAALIELLRRGWEEPDLVLFLEALDDVEIQGGDARESLQIKHHTGGSGSLTDASVDLWRTFAVWLDILPDLAPGEQPSFTLLTTGQAPDGSAASLLRADGARDETAALGMLETAAATSSNQQTEAARERFTQLLPNERMRLVRWQPELRTLVETNADDAQVFEERLESPRDGGTVDVHLGPWWQGDLTDFQERDLKKLLGLSHGANFSVPGAGKTRVALGVFQHRREEGEIERMMVVCPKSAFEAWHEETRESFSQSGPNLRLSVYEGVAADCDILLVNYERLPEAEPALLRWLRSQPSLLVLDEAHRTQLGPAGAWGSVSLALGPFARRRLILTGTPAPNGPRDLENLMSFVWPGQGRMAVTRALANANLREASTILRPLFVRTTKKELGLPPVTTTKRPVTLPPRHRELYRALLGQYAGARAGAADIEALGRVVMYLLMAATTPALLATGSSRYEPLAYQVPPLEPPEGSSLADLMRDLPLFEHAPKYQEVRLIVAENAAAGRKTLVWSTFVRNLTTLALLLEPYSPAVVHGGTEDRDEQLRRFRNDAECMVLLSNPATLGEGISLHHICHDAVYLDRDFAAGRFLQSLDRIHRLGLQPGTETRVTVLLASETIDEVVEQRLAAKLQFMGRILDDPEVEALADLDEEPSVSVGMDSTDVEALLAHLGTNASR